MPFRFHENNFDLIIIKTTFKYSFLDRMLDRVFREGRIAEIQV
jgi:hypothetical protein